MNKNIACAWGHAELRSILKDYFSGEIENSLIIFSAHDLRRSLNLRNAKVRKK